MSTHRNFDKICCVVLAITLILSVLFVNAGHFGVRKASDVMGYENTLFDSSRVHTLNIVMDDWDEFTANCKSEEYYNCTVVIDNEAYKNVAIRGKGNTSLTQVESYGNDRYSFKIEFDHYDSGNTYYGLDKLCLNNIIQDNTYMKDYLAYQMMNEIGVASPLCSYVYITVNGEDWGLYLAVEGVEESFLQRNYGSGYGELYKPDSMGMGGGRGNGKQFDMKEFMDDSESESVESNNNTNDTFPPMPDGQMPENMTPPADGSINFDGQMPEGMAPPTDGTMENTDGNTEHSDGDAENNSDKNRMPGGMKGGRVPGNMPGGFGGGMNKGSDDVLLKYIDDDVESYSNIFDNAKTAVSDADKTRLIEALKKLGSGEELESTVDIDSVIRYFVVHNFVLNFDSYTGMMIHNYYLYENDGQMQMIPWDYNLAFGGFQSMGSATSLVNYPIDSPVSGGNAADRPMIAWIFDNEEYTELYHKYFSEFISEYFDSGYFEKMIDSVNAMISPCVEKDPTRFCTYEEFETGIATLKEFCLLRAKSISSQLDGTIGSTSDTQENDTLIDAGDIQIDDMGSMGSSMGGGMPGDNMQKPQGKTDDSDIQKSPSSDDSGNSDNTDMNETGENSLRQKPSGQKPDGIPPDFANGGNGNNPLILIGVSVLVLILGLGFALTYKRSK